MDARHIEAAMRKEHMLGKRQSLATEEGTKKKPRIWLSAEEKVAHAWVAACDAGDIRVVDLLLPVVENSALGVNCADGAGLTGLMAALEKGRLEVVDRLLDHKDIDMDFTQTDAGGRNALDLVILSPSDHFMDLILDRLETNCCDKELEKVLLPRLLSCVSLGKVEKFKRMLDFFDVNFQEGALLSFLIIAGEAKFIRILSNYCNEKEIDVFITEQNKRSFVYALKTGRSSVVQPLFSDFPRTFGKQLENILIDPLPILGTETQVEAVRSEIFSMLKEMIILQSSSRPTKFCTFEIGINCINVNAMDDDGFTLLMMAVISARLIYVKLLLAKKSLEVNLTNQEGCSALNFLDTYCFTADQLLTLFLERQAVFKDVDFSEVQMPLLLKTLDMDRFDLASSLLDCSTYHATPEELSTARGILAKELSPMGRRPWASEYLLHKIEMKERQEEKRSQEAA